MKFAEMIEILEEEYPQFIEPIVTTIGKENKPFKVLISTIISLRTKDAVTAAASKKLFILKIILLNNPPC